MTIDVKIDKHRIALAMLLMLAFLTRSAPSLSSVIPTGQDPYLYGAATVNLLNERSIPGALPYSHTLTYTHLESILFLFFLVPFKLIFSDMSLVLRIVPGVLGVIDVLGIYMFVRALTKEESIAVISAFFLVFNPFHAFFTKMAAPEGLALGLLFLSMYLFLENSILLSGVAGGLILLTDYLIFGHFLLFLGIYLLTNLNKDRAKAAGVVLLLALLVALPWQFYLYSVSEANSFTGNVGSLQPEKAISARVFADTVYMLPKAITPIHAIFVVGGLYIGREKDYFRFLSLGLVFFLILSFIKPLSLGLPPHRHLITLTVFSSILSGVFLDSLKTRKPLIAALILLSLTFYVGYSIDHYVEVPRETLTAANWISEAAPSNAVISAPTVAYAVFTGKTVIYEPNPCTGREADYVIVDRNLERYPLSYGRKGKVLNIQDFTCLELAHSTGNIDIYKVNR